MQKNAQEICLFTAKGLKGKPFAQFKKGREFKEFLCDPKSDKRVKNTHGSMEIWKRTKLL